MLKSERAKQQKADNRKKIDAYLAQKAEVADWDPKADADYQALLSADGRFEEQAKAFAEGEQAERAAAAIDAKAGDGTAKVRDVKERFENDRSGARGFASARDFNLSVIKNATARDRDQIRDKRLVPLALVDDDSPMGDGMTYLLPKAFTPSGLKAAVGSDEQGVYDDRYGGFAVPTTTLNGMLQLGFEGDPTTGRTQNIPMATPQVSILARTDKNHTTSVSGGFTVSRRPETAAGTSSRGEIEKISLLASGLFGLAYATEEILSDSAISFVAIIQAGFRDQYMHQILREKILGAGGAEFLGAMNSPALISVAKESGQVADTLVTANLTKMRSRCWGYGNAIWLANHDTYPQLASLSVGIGAAGALVYQQSVVEDRPDMLLGRPIFYTEYAATVGDQGDVLLVNWSQYLEGTYEPLQSAESVHVRFVNHERTFKFWLRNAGAPWWRSALTPNRSSATLSPLVTLDARA